MAFRALACRFGLSLSITCAAVLAGVPPASATLQKLVYEVSHATYGPIGTYSNTIDSKGGQTTVTTEGRIRVSLVGIVLFRQDFDRIERWVGERLMSFQGRTTTNGHSIDVKGEAEGDKFAVSSPSGSFMAPAAVKVANPWSEAVLKGAALLTPDRGLLEDVQVRSAGMTEVPINGAKLRARRYEIVRTTGEKKYDVWIDDEGTPVMFSVNTRRGTVTFTLTS